MISPSIVLAALFPRISTTAVLLRQQSFVDLSLLSVFIHYASSMAESHGKSIHTDHINSVEMVPIKYIIRPIPSVLDVSTVKY